ncbi:MAG: TolB family protein [Gaiellaceae bacterium]
MRRRLLFLSLILVVAPVASATPPGTNGRIAFLRLEFQNSPLTGGLWVQAPGGGKAIRVTRPPGDSLDANPDWSPDGRRIVFTRVPETGAASIWVVRANTGALRRISPPCPRGGEIPACAADDSWPVWSPDGRHLAFQRLAGALRPKGSTINTATAIYKDELVVTNTDGTHARTLVWRGPWRGDPQSPAWSPDGKRIVFIGKFMSSKTNGTGCECRSLWVVNVDGKDLHQILAPGRRPGGRPDWSPDGKTILFRTHPGDDPSGYGANLYTIHPDGSGLRQLTHYAGYERVLEGSYSPDGTQIVFGTTHDSVGGSLPDLFVMDADGTRVRPLTRSRNFESDSDWGTG